MLLIVDANVLIDYANTDPSVLTLVSRHIGQIHVPSVVLEEVNQLNEEDCESLGLTIQEEPLEILTAAAEKRGALSFEDYVCLLLAKENDWVCVSNDRPLHRACESEEVTVMWGL
ncbi:MAG: type II toxin-antitoxin system VapC family toxin [Sedimenticola sp.]